MTDLVDAASIEQLVGTRRHQNLHIGRAVSAEQKVYILHSHDCLDSGADLRECRYSVALDRGIDATASPWEHYQDRAVQLLTIDGTLIPVHMTEHDHRRRIQDSAEQLLEARRELDADVSLARADGITWRAIGDALGVTRQAAQERFAHVQQPTTTQETR